MSTFNILTEEEFEKRYPLIKNHLCPSAPFDDCMFETFGKELEFVRSQPAVRIWTLLDCDGSLVVSSGFHFVNRLGYLISAVPVPDGHHYEVSIDDLTDADEEEAV
jgi:hypothetical protein